MLMCLSVALGGAIGSVARYLIGQIKITESNIFPFKTLAINIIGSFWIGVIAAILAKKGNLNSNIDLFLRVGVCGGFTTFSTFAFETSGLLQDGRLISAAVYVFLSVVVSVAAIFFAQRII